MKFALLLTACCLLPAAVSAAPTATELLGMLDWTPENLATATDDELAQLAVRLKRLTNDELAEVGRDEQAEVRKFVGILNDVTWNQVGELQYAKLSVTALSREQFEVITAAAPERWRNDTPQGDMIQLVGLTSSKTRDRLVTPRVKWTPTKHRPPIVNFGEALLGAAGVNVAELETPVDRRPLERTDRASFYEMLAAMRTQSTAKLAELARGRVGEFAAEFTGENAPTERRRLTKLVAAAAEEGAYSVAPLFLAPQDLRGELFTFDTVVRRAVRIEVSPAADTHGVTHYYELEAYPADSQNLPLVFCVPEIPAGFATGDDIAQPARLAGFFYKQWRYAPRRAPTNDQTRQFAPLLIGPAPQILKTHDSTMSPLTPLIAGGMVVCLILLAAFLWRTHREDR
jgi:hypothetical protein